LEEESLVLLFSSNFASWEHFNIVGRGWGVICCLRLGSTLLLVESSGEAGEVERVTLFSAILNDCALFSLALADERVQGLR